MYIAGVFTRAKSSKGALIYFPWIAITSIIQIVDVVASIIYGIDIPNTMVRFHAYLFQTVKF